MPHVFATQVDSRNDGRDFDQVRHSMRYVGYSEEEVGTVWKLLAAILHLVSIPAHVDMVVFVESTTITESFSLVGSGRQQCRLH